LAVIQKDLERITSNSHESGLEKSFGSGEGFATDPIVKSVVEDYAVRSAVSHYQKLGYVVKERGKPYDLLCTKGMSQLFVEVKGSRTACAGIILTRNEVRFAEKNVGRMQLFVLAKISVRRVEGDFTASGGKKHVMPWTIDRARLTPLQFSYKLSDFSQ
jgi:hypothetical protein